MRTNSALHFALVTTVLLLNTHAKALDLVWIGGTGDWNVAGNWSPAQVPTAADNAWITNSGSYTVTVPAGSTAVNNSLTLGGASGTQVLAVDRATLALNAGSFINGNGQLTLLVAQSVVNGAGSLTVDGMVDWENGTISGVGGFTVNSRGVLAIGSGGVTLGRSLNNGGSCTWAGGNLTITGGQVINNLAGATFDVTADGRLSGGSTTPISNSGLFRLTAGVTGTTITPPFSNSGTLQVLASSLSLNQGGTHTGTFDNSAGATLNFGGGTHALNPGSLVTGAGLLNVSGAATLAANGNFSPGTTLSITAGIATVGPGCDVSGTTINVGGAGGALLFNGAGGVAALNVSAGTVGGTSPIGVSGPLSLAGGTITNGVVSANGGLSISGNTTLNGTKLMNPATAVWSGGNLTGVNGAAISNLVGAVFINSFDGNMATGQGATPFFDNAGTFHKSDGSAALGSTSIDFQFLNTGTVEVSTNTLRLASNQQTAGLTLLDGGGLSAQAQPLQFSGGSLIGAGPLTVANVQNVINTAVFSPGLPLGEVDISGNYQQTGSGVLNIDLGGYSPGITHDLVTVSAGGGGGGATLGGTLNVSLVNSFVPTNGASFTFLTASSRAGVFATFNYPSNDVGMQVTYQPASVMVKVTNLKPVVAHPISDPAPVTYGSAFTFQFPADTFTDPDGDQLTYSASGLPPGISFTAATRTFAGTPTKAGAFVINLAATDNGTPSLSVTNTFTITISPATLTVTAQAQSKTYGAADPALTFTISGLQLGDNQSDVMSGALARSPGESVSASPYSIGQGTLATTGNYVISFSGSVLTINPAPLSVTANPKSKVYGAADPAFTISFAGFVNGDTAAALGGALVFVRAPGENVGSYAITPSGLNAVNYSIAFNPGMLTITKATLAVTADNKSKTYGSADPALTFTASGLQFNDAQATVLSGTLTRAPGETVAGGPYAITQGTLAANANYTITFTGSSLAITPAALAITAESKAKTYGATDPALTFTLSGLQFNDTQATVLSGSLTRTPGETVAGGPYAITQGTLIANANYSVTFNSSTLVITPAALTVTADNQTKAYGAPLPHFTLSYSGFVNGDMVASLATPANASTTATSSSPAGTFPITVGGAVDSNYSISYVPGTLTITAVPLTISPNDQSKIYGAAVPELTLSYIGFVNGDTAANLTAPAVATTTATAGSPAGTYSITVGGSVDANYIITFTSGTLTIDKAPLSVTADSKTKIAGTADPVFTVSYSGFVNGETPAVLSGTLAITRAPGESMGTYAISPSGLSSSNYSITFSAGTLTIIGGSTVVLPLVFKAGNGIEISWSALSNLTYRVQYTSDLASGAWTDLAGDILANSSTASIKDILTPTNRFYRIRVLP